MRNKILSKLLVAFIVASVMSASTLSSGAFIVFAQSPTLDDVFVELEALNGRLDELEANMASGIGDVEANITAMNLVLGSLNAALDDIDSILYSISATTASAAQTAVLSSALDELNDMTINIESIVESLNSTAANNSQLVAVSSTVDEISATLTEVNISLNYLKNAAATSDELRVTKDDLTRSMETLQLLVIVVLVLALVAAVAAIAAVYVMIKNRRAHLTSN